MQRTDDWKGQKVNSSNVHNVQTTKVRLSLSGVRDWATESRLLNYIHEKTIKASGPKKATR